MQSSICLPSSAATLKPFHNPFAGDFLYSKPCLFIRKRASFTTKALLSSTKESVLKDFHEKKALKIISGLKNFDRDNIASVVTAADKICVSSVDPLAFPATIDAGALMVEIGNYDSFYEEGKVFFSEQILNLTKKTKEILPSVTLSVTVPHTLSLPNQVRLAEILEQEGVDIIQTEGGKSSKPSKSGILGLIVKTDSYLLEL